jgi:hypothetical protein
LSARNILPSDSRLWHLRFFPLLIILADWCENLCLIVVIHAFPDRHDTIATVAALFTSLKWTLLMLVAVMLVTAGTLLVRKYFQDRTVRRR